MLLPFSGLRCSSCWPSHWYANIARSAPLWYLYIEPCLDSWRKRRVVCGLLNRPRTKGELERKVSCALTQGGATRWRILVCAIRSDEQANGRCQSYRFIFRHIKRMIPHPTYLCHEDGRYRGELDFYVGVAPTALVRESAMSTFMK
jgi:hypothetical protein